MFNRVKASTKKMSIVDQPGWCPSHFSRQEDGIDGHPWDLQLLAPVGGGPEFELAVFFVLQWGLSSWEFQDVFFGPWSYFKKTMELVAAKDQKWYWTADLK